MDKYSKVREIGKGSFGVAILCQRKSDGKQCVMKHISLKQMPQREVTRTLQESELLARLQHPNIVTLFESFIDRTSQKLAIVMEYANGGDLEAYLKKRRGRPFPESEVLQIFVQMCLAIKHIHDRKILHRDLKCQNVFLTSSGVVKVGDFGIAKVLKNTRELANTRIGTPYYMSPELMENKRYNSKTDIWSLGIILYEMLCLRLPFEGRSMNELVRNIIRANPAPLSSSFSKEIRDLTFKMLSKSTSSRPGINAILSLEIIQRRISSFLDETTKKAEFSHTVLHGQNIMAKAKLAPPPSDHNTNEAGLRALPKPPRPPTSKELEAGKVFPKQEQRQNANPLGAALADARKKAGEAERKALLAAQERQKLREREKQMERQREKEREKQKEKEREVRRRELALREKKRAEEAAAAKERQRRMQMEIAAMKERRRSEEARALAAKKAAAAKLKEKELKEAAMAKNIFSKARDNKVVGGVVPSAAKQNRIYKSDYQQNANAMVNRLLAGKAAVVNKPPPPPPRVAPSSKPAVPRQAVGVSRQQQQVLQQAVKGVRKPLVPAKAPPEMPIQIETIAKEGIDRVMARIRKESERRIMERDKMAARGRARIAEHNRVPSAAGVISKISSRSPSQSQSKSSNTGPNVKMHNKLNLKLSLEDVVETSQEFIQSLSPKKLSSKKKLSHDTDASTVSSDITVSETHGEGDSLASEREILMRKKKPADIVGNAPHREASWLGNLEKQMGDLQKRVEHLKSPSNDVNRNVSSPKQTVGVVKPPPPPSRAEKIVPPPMKANVASNPDTTKKKVASTDDLNQRRVNREKGRLDFKAFLKQQKVQTPDHRSDGIILSPEGTVPLNLPNTDSSNEKKEDLEKKRPVSQLKPSKEGSDESKESFLVNPSRIVKGAGKEAIKNQRDAERAQLKQMIQAGRRAKAAEKPIVVECLEVEDNENKEAPRSSAWAATLGRSTDTIEEDADIGEVRDDQNVLDSSKISLNSVTKEQLDVDEVIELEDSEDGSNSTEGDLELGNTVTDLDADIDAEAGKIDDVSSDEFDGPEIGLTPDRDQDAADLDDMRDLVECMKVAADVATRTDLDDVDDDEFEEDDTDDAEDEIEDTEEVIQAWAEADKGDLSREDIDFLAELGVEFSTNEHADDDAIQEADKGDLSREDIDSLAELGACPMYATIDPYPTKEFPVEAGHKGNGNESDSVDEWSKDEGCIDKLEHEDPLQKSTNLSLHESYKDEAQRLQSYLNENLGADSVIEVIEILESIDTDSSEEELLAEVEKVIGSQGLLYLDDFFKLLTCMSPR